MRGFLSALVVCLVAWSLPVQAMAPASPSNVELSEVRDMIKAGNAEEAIPKLQKYVEANPEDADGFNLLGYGYRKSSQFDLSKQAYDRALTLDPKHKQAHEYLGELYLQTGQPEKAEALLVELGRICGGDSCEEYEELRVAIADFKRGTSTKKW